MRTITSAQNQIIKSVARLHNKKDRDQTGLFLAEGKRTVETLLKSTLKIQQIHLTKSLFEKWHDIQKYQEYITLVPSSLIQKMSSAKTASEIVVVFEKPIQPDNTQLAHGIVLANLNDPGNMGTLIRTAAALNTTTIVVINGADPWGPKVIQASAGTIGFVNIFELSFDQLIHNKQDLELVALVAAHGEALHTIESKKSLLVIGNEAHGLPIAWQNACEKKVTIPMPGNIESLNAAVAGSIALYMTYMSY